MRNFDSVKKVQRHDIGQKITVLHYEYDYWRDLILINRQKMIEFKLSEPKLIARSSD